MALTRHDVARMFAEGDRGNYREHIESMSVVGERSVIEMVAGLPVTEASAFTITTFDGGAFTVVVLEEKE
jgi:hypothetical protein